MCKLKCRGRWDGGPLAAPRGAPSYVSSAEVSGEENSCIVQYGTPNPKVNSDISHNSRFSRVFFAFFSISSSGTWLWDSNAEGCETLNVWLVRDEFPHVSKELRTVDRAKFIHGQRNTGRTDDDVTLLTPISRPSYVSLESRGLPAIFIVEGWDTRDASDS